MNGQSRIIVEVAIGNDFIDISNFVQSVEWEGNGERAFRQVNISMVNTVDGRTRRFNIGNGARIRVSNNGREIFRGRIFAFDIDHTGNQSITAYDTTAYLTKSVTNANYKNVTATAIIRRLATTFGVTIGQADETGYVIPKLNMEEKTVYEIMKYALELTEEQTGRTFSLFNREGRLHLVERKNRTIEEIIEDGANLLSASYSQSIEDMRNRVVVIGGDKESGEFRAVEQNREIIDLYGYMQHVERMSEQDVTESQVKQRAKQLLAELATIEDSASISALGNDQITAGSVILARNEMTGIIGEYYVISDKHSFSNGLHTMDLKLTAKEA